MPRHSPSRLPLLYFGFAHLCLAATGIVLAADPWAYSGFFYHHRMMVPVHLVTLGWITSSIIGALYMIAPMALRTRLRQGRLDAWVCGAYVCGVSGMMSHFWLASYGGMLWSAGLVVGALLLVAWRTLAAVFQAPIAGAVKLHLLFAFANLLLAATTGAVLGWSKLGLVALPSGPLPTVYAHAHLAVLGWATMMIFGVAYRLLPMLLPAAVPSGASLVAGAVVFELGVLTLFTALILDRPSWVAIAAVWTAVAIAFFFVQLGWMLRHPKPPPKARPRPDLPLLQVAQAMAYLVVAVFLGLVIALENLSPSLILRLAPVYATCALVGFVAQMIVAVLGRLWPLYAWLLTFTDGEDATPPPSPWKLVDRRLQSAILGVWSLLVPILAAAFYWQQPSLVVIAGLLLFTAAVLSAIALAVMLQRAHQ